MDGAIGSVALGRLTASDQWRPWISQIKAIAIQGDIWDQINPELPIEPEAPSAPRRPVPSDVKRDAQLTSDLTNTELSRYRDLLGVYQVERAEYEYRVKSRQMILRIIASSIDQRYEAFLVDQYSPYRQLRTLHELFQSSDRTRIQTLRRKWQKLFRTTIDKDSVGKWLSEVHQQYLEGHQAGVPEIQHQESVIFDILSALKPVAPGFCEIWYHEIFNKSRSIDVPRFIRTFLNQADFQVQRSTISQAAFSTWQGHTEANRQQCVCGKSHTYDKCFYLNPTICPEKFELRQEVKDRIKKKLQSEELLNEVKLQLPNFRIEDLDKKIALYTSYPGPSQVSF